MKTKGKGAKTKKKCIVRERRESRMCKTRITYSERARRKSRTCS